MLALGLGLVAAFSWGIHDICVRRVSQDTPLMASLLLVLIAGTVFHLGLMGLSGEFETPPKPALGYSALAGVFFLMASLGLYGAFQRGPVRLVSPIIASFPIFSIAWASLRGTPISAGQWIAVVVIIVGVSVVAILSDDSKDDVPPKARTILYSIIASIGFAATFAIGQLAAEMSDHLPATLFTRVTAIALLIVLIFAWRLPMWPGRRAVPILVLMGCLDGIALVSVLAAGGLRDAAYAAVTASVFGLLTIVMAWAFLNERMSAMQWAGVALSFAGIGYLAL